MGRGRRAFLVACVASLLSHLGVIGNVGLMWITPAKEVPLPIAAHLVLPEQEPQSIPVTKAEPEPLAITVPLREPMLPPDTQAHSHNMLEPVPLESPSSNSSTPPQPVPDIISPIDPVIPAPRPLRQLPPRLTLRYDVQSGEDGFTLGRAVYTWTQSEDRYRLESVAESTGVISLFISGRIHQISEGRVMAEGLQPRFFSLTRGDRRPDTAQFNWDAGSVDLNGPPASLPVHAQDLLSFPFHLALSLRGMEDEWSLAVTNGRQIKLYAFMHLGRDILHFQDAPLETLHVRGARSGEGALDVWLAPSHDWLPIRLRTLDTKGRVITLHLLEVER